MKTGDSMKQRAANSFYRVCSFCTGRKSNSKAFPLGKDIIDTWSEKFDRFSSVYSALAIRVSCAINEICMRIAPLHYLPRKAEFLVSCNLFDKYCLFVKRLISSSYLSLS